MGHVPPKLDLVLCYRDSRGCGAVPRPSRPGGLRGRRRPRACPTSVPQAVDDPDQDGAGHDKYGQPAGRLRYRSLAHEFPMQADWMTSGVSHSLPASIDKRPSPEELLRRVQAEERRARRGRLKVFLGYASRVGKSFRMLDEGRRRKERGEGVVVAAIQFPLTPDLEALMATLEF